MATQARAGASGGARGRAVAGRRARRSGRTSARRRCPGCRAGPAAHGARWPTKRRARAQPRDDEWWRHFDDPVLDQLVAEAQRLNPGVRTAGMRIMEARAQLGIAGSGLYPQLQQVNARGAARPATAAATAAAPTFWSGWPGFRPGLGAGLLGQVQARHRVGRCRLLRQHRAVRRRAGAGRGAGGEPVRDRSAPPSCGCASRNENAAIQKRSLEITERLFRSGNESELDVQQARSQYLSTLATIPELESSLRQTRNALCVLLARPPDALPELQRRAREDSRSAARGDRRHAGRAAAAPARRARRRDAAGRAVGADRHQRGGAVSVDRARRVGGPVGHHASARPAPRSTGPSARRWCGTCSTTAG